MNIPQRDKPEGKKQKFLPIPTWHWGAPEDLAGSLIFLSLKVSNYVLWAFLPINSGFFGADPSSSSANRKVKTIHRFYEEEQ